MTGQLPAPIAQRAGAGPDKVLHGIALMFASTFLISTMHIAIRHVSGAIHPFEIAFFRSLFALVVVLPWFVRYGLGPLRTRRIGLHGLRAVFNVGAMLAFFYALSIAPLAEVTALGFTAPIFATALAALLLGEVVGPRRWSAILVGFAGVLLIVRPGLGEIGPGQLLTLGSSLSWACALLVIKTLSRTDSSVTIITYMGLLMMPLVLVPALFAWQWPSAVQLFWLVLIGVLGGSGQLCMTEALRQADTAVVMPIDFCKLLWVSALAFVVFGEIPDLFTWLGGSVIFASTLYIAYRARARALAR